MMDDFDTERLLKFAEICADL